MSLTRYVDAYEQSARAVADLARGRTSEEWSRDTDCPGWVVADQVAHVSALEHQFVGDPLPPDLPSYGPHVHGIVGEHTERGVVAYRRDDPDLAARELSAVLDRRFAALRSTGVDPTGETIGLLGNRIAWARFLPVRCFDVWAHEQDIRLALGLPVVFEGTSGDAAMEAMLAVLPMAVARGAGAPPGSSVAFDLAGSPGAAVTVLVDESGRGRLDDGADGDATAVVRCEVATLSRLVCGRVEPVPADVVLDGDRELGQRVLGSLAITP
jgi:uncharacterized protein (TIGR03083 family)